MRCDESEMANQILSRSQRYSRAFYFHCTVKCHGIGGYVIILFVVLLLQTNPISVDECKTNVLIFFFYREFYYIQMEKYARQAISEGLKTAEDLHVASDSELYRVLNLHYNRNNHIEVSFDTSSTILNTYANTQTYIS